MLAVSLILFGLALPALGMDDVAVCELKGEVSGVIEFHQMNQGVHMAGEVLGLPKGYHGFHLHKEPYLTDGCKDAGSHYNPYNKNHGSLVSAERHEGDFGNILSEGDRKAKVDITALNAKLENFVNRALVVHEGQDDLGQGGNGESLLTGNAGKRLNCCLVQWKNSASSVRLNILGGLVIALALLI